jgi:hypothetical protein
MVSRGWSFVDQRFFSLQSVGFFISVKSASIPKSIFASESFIESAESSQSEWKNLKGGMDPTPSYNETCSTRKSLKQKPQQPVTDHGAVRSAQVAEEQAPGMASSHSTSLVSSVAQRAPSGSSAVFEEKNEPLGMQDTLSHHLLHCCSCCAGAGETPSALVALGAARLRDVPAIEEHSVEEQAHDFF